MFGGTTERGQTLPFIALLLVVLLGFTGMAVDVGYLRSQQRVQQSAADSAALAAAAELGFGTDIQAAARTDAATNGFTNGTNNVTVTAVNPPATGNYTSDNGAVEVNITARYDTFFMRIFPNLGISTIKTRAVARRSDNTYCLILLQSNPPTPSNFNDANVQMPDCSAAINQTASPNMHGLTINAAGISYAGTAPNENDATFSSATPAPSLPASDPCMQIAGCRYLTDNPPPTNPCTGSYTKPKTGSGSLAAGCYGALDIHGQNIFMNPGVYVFTGNVNGSKATITGNNVTIYLTGSGQLNFSGATLDLSAPTTGDTADVLFYQAASDTNSVNLEGASCDGCTSTINGLLYFPAAFVNYNHHGGGYTVSVFGAVNFNKSESDYAAPPDGGSLIKKAVLAE
jgi:hypothetical protein